MKVIKFFSRLFKPSWLPKEYFLLKEKYGDNFEIDGYSHTGSIIRKLRIKLFSEYWTETVTDDFEFIGKIEMRQRIKDIFIRIIDKSNH